MTAGRRPPRPRTRKTAVDPTTVLLEDMRAHNKIVLEAVVALDEKMERSIATFRAEMSERGDLLESSIRTLSSRVGGVDTRLDSIDTRLDGIDTRLDGIDTRLDGIDTRLDGIDTRLDGIDTRLDGIDTRLDGIDTRLDGIDTRLDGIDEQLAGVRQEAREQAVLWARKADAAALAALDQRVTALERGARI